MSRYGHLSRHETAPAREHARFAGGSGGTTVAAWGCVTTMPNAPFHHGPFSVSAETISVAGPGADLVEVTADAGGRLCTALANVHGCTPESLERLRRQLRRSFEAGDPLHAVAQGLAAGLGEARATVAVLRLSHYEGCAEVLNVGMPPVTCVLSSGRVARYEAQSEQLCATSRAVHPYTAVSLPWDGLWLLVSDGLTFGARDAASHRALVEALGVRQLGLALAATPPAELARLMRAAAGNAPFRRDATLVAVAAAASTAAAPE